MKLPLDKKILNPYINMLVKRCKLLYGIKDTSNIEKRLNSINGLYITDSLPDNNPMCFNVVENVIYLNKNYIEKDENGEYLVSFDKCSALFKHSLIHELLHVASFKENGVGIILKGEGAYKTALNEGITQMMTDDICGYYENKFLGSYNFEKIIAHIIRLSVGKELLTNSYFENPNLLKDKIKKISKESSLYPFLNAQLTINSSIKDETVSIRKNEILKLVIINIVVPTFNSMNRTEREVYLTKLLFGISGDEVIKNQVIDYLNKYINYNGRQIRKENESLSDGLIKLDMESEAIKILPNMNRILVKDDGTIYVIKPSKTTIKSREDKEKVYIALFNLNGYKEQITESVKESYKNAILSGKTLRINHESVLRKRIIFCGIKDMLFKEGYYLLNDYEEFDNSNEVSVKYINTSVCSRDYKQVCDVFSIVKNKVGNDSYTYSVVYNSTKNELEDEALKKMVFFSINWLLSTQDNGMNGIEEAFNADNMRKLYSLLNLLCTINEKFGNISADFVERYYTDKKLIRKLLKTPIQLEWVYDYIMYVGKNGPINERKGLSFEEVEKSSYQYNKAVTEAKEIVLKNI